MNTLTHGTDSYPFSTADELLALPCMQGFSHFACNGKTLMAYDDKGFMRVVGTFKERFMLPLVNKRVTADQN